MPVVGREENNTHQFAKSYQNDPMFGMAAQYLNTVKNILEQHQISVFGEATKAAMIEESDQALKDFFLTECCDMKGMTEEEAADYLGSVEQLYNNDKKAVLEYASSNSFNPVLGLTYPIHKNIMMNNVFDNGVLTKMVSASPRFTISMETRTMTTPDGRVLDLWKDQHLLTDAVESTAPMKYVPIALPEFETTDILKDVFNATNRHDNLSIETYVSHVLVKAVLAKGDTAVTFTPPTVTEGVVTNPAVFTETIKEEDGTIPEYTWKEVNAYFAPYYGEFDRTITQPLRVEVCTKLATETTPAEYEVVEDCITGFMRKNRFLLQTRGTIPAIKLGTRIDTSTALLQTCEVGWSVKTDPVEIPNAIPFNVPISPEEVKDIGALYNVNQLTKIMSMIKLIMGNTKDDKIKKHLDESFVRLPEISKIARSFDFAPPQQYSMDHIEHRYKTFMEALDTYVGVLMQYLRDPNMTVSIVGRSELISKIVPEEGYLYQTPESIGPVELDFVRTVVSRKHKRVYQFVSTDKMIGNNNLIILLNPRNTDRIIYRIYDYQTYVSNEIRNAQLYTLPAIHAFERWKFVEYQGVQGRVQILHPDGLLNHVPNTDPIGKSARTDHELVL